MEVEMPNSGSILPHTDHDTLITLVQLVKNQNENTKIISDNLVAHETKDQTNFDKIREDILGLQRVVWIATGIIISLDAIPKVGEILHLLK